MESPQSLKKKSKKKKKKDKDNKHKTEVTLDFIPAKEGHSCPFVGYFPSGFDPDQYKGKKHNKNPFKKKDNDIDKEEEEEEEEETRLQVRGYQNMEKYKSRQHQLVVTPSDGGVDFVGSNFYGEGAVWQPGNYALGVFNKDTQTLQLLPIAGSKVLRMEPRVRGVDYDIESNLGAMDVEISKEMMLQKRNLLTSTFGTHKSQIRLKRYERGRVKDDALGDKEEIGRLFEKAGDNVSVLTSEEALQKANDAIKRNIPPYDLTATTCERAYILSKIITPEEQSCLDDIDSLKAAIGKQEKIEELQRAKPYPEFVLVRLQKLKYLQDESKNRRLMILSYLRHLLAFYNLPRHVIKSIVDPLGSHGDRGTSKAIDLTSYAKIPDTVAAKLIKLFTDANNNESRVQTTEKKNLLISYILVLGLMIDDYRADPYDLAVELRMSISELKKHYMEIGCKFKAVKEADRGAVDLKSAQRLYEAVLPVPLQFPTLRNTPKRKR